MVSKVDFEVGHPETPVIPERVIDDGAYVAASSLAPRLAVEATSTPRLSSGSPQVRLVRDAATGLYRAYSPGGKLLTDAGSKAAFEAAGSGG